MISLVERSLMQLLGREMEVKHQIFQLDIVVPLEQADVMEVEVEGAHLHLHLHHPQSESSAPQTQRTAREHPCQDDVSTIFDDVRYSIGYKNEHLDRFWTQQCQTNPPTAKSAD